MLPAKKSISTSSYHTCHMMTFAPVRYHRCGETRGLGDIILSQFVLNEELLLRKEVWWRRELPVNNFLLERVIQRLLIGYQCELLRGKHIKTELTECKHEGKGLPLSSIIVTLSVGQGYASILNEVNILVFQFLWKDYIKTTFNALVSTMKGLSKSGMSGPVEWWETMKAFPISSV